MVVPGDGGAPHSAATLWVPLADLLVDRLAGVITTLELPNVHVVDTRGTLVRAVPRAVAASNDWLNEIHPTAAGFSKLALRWRAAIEAVLAT